MSASVLGADALRALRPLEVASYLRVHGWRQEADLNGKGSVWLLPAEDGREETDITLPLQRDLGDFALRMGDVLRTLRQVERRPEPEILQDLMTTSSDLIRVRAPSREADSGSLPLEQAVAFVERARDLVLAAACAAITKRAYFATRKPTKATEYLSRVRMGQTERGSYVLTILSPVAPALAPEGELPLDLEPSEPYERQVTRTLAEGLAAMELAARDAAASGGMGGFEQAVQRGVSANLCDAVAGLSAVSPGEGLDIRIAWSRTRPVDEHRAVAGVPGQRQHPADPGSRTAVQGHRASRGRGAAGFRDPPGARPHGDQRRSHLGGSARWPVAPCHRRTGRRYLLAGRASP